MTPSTWSLRRRLVVTLVALLAAVSAVIGVVSVLALDQFLQHRLDQQLRSAVGRSAAAVGPGLPEQSFVVTGGQAEGTLSALFVDGTLRIGGVVDDDGSYRALPRGTDTALASLPVDGRPHTVTLPGGLDGYRVIATPVAGGRVVVTGLPTAEADRTVYRLALVVTLVAVAGLVALGLIGTAVVRLALRPLERVAATAARVAELPLDRGEVDLAVRVPEADTDPATEVGRVGAALNRLLDHVAAALAARHASESRMRRFVADASHELRTPLAAIRGYAELPGRSGHDLPDDVVHALGRIEASSDRMSALVEDLLLLARLDEGRPLEQADVDLSAVVTDAVADAVAAGPEHRFELRVPDEPVVVTGDTGRLHQVVANLLTNARVHTPAGTTVRVALETTSEAAVRLRVSDDGPGIDPQLLPSVFERFARGDSSRSRRAGSTGLGLAIVDAVVEAHGGGVAVSSVPGATTFTVELPVRSAPTG